MENKYEKKGGDNIMTGLSCHIATKHLRVSERQGDK